MTTTPQEGTMTPEETEDLAYRHEQSDPWLAENAGRGCDMSGELYPEVYGSDYYWCHTHGNYSARRWTCYDGLG